MWDKQTIVILGNGVAANVLGYYLRHDPKTEKATLVQIYDDDRFLPCSQRTLAHNSLRNTQKGISDLGDLLVDAFAESAAFFESVRPEGVYACEHLHQWREDSDQAPGFARRYRGVSYRGDRIAHLTRPFGCEWELAQNHAYVIDPERYLVYLAREARYDRVVREAVVGVDHDGVRLESGQRIAFDHLFLCTGFYTHRFAKLFTDSAHLDRSKPVSGSCLVFDLADFDPSEFTDLTRAFCFDVEEVNVVFRPQSRQLLLGATSRDDCDSPEPDARIFAKYEKVRACLKGVLTLPPPEKAVVQTGVRHKGHRRRPYWGRIAPGIYATYGLYKNAFMTANLAAKALVRRL